MRRWRRVAISACSSQGIKLAKTAPTGTGAAAVPDPLLGLPHALARRRRGLGDLGPGPPAHAGAELQLPQGGVARVLYAIRNGGFSGQIMPQNIVVGSDAKAVAQFLAKYAGPRGAARRRRSARSQHLLGLAAQPTPGSAVLDLRLIREQPDAVRAALARRDPRLRRRASTRSLALDARRREILPELEALRAAQERAPRRRSPRAQARGRRTPTDAIARMRDARRARARARARARERRRRARRARCVALPNLPSADAADEDTVVRTVGEPRGGPALDHLELAGALIDMEAGGAPLGRALRLPQGRSRDARAGARALGARAAARAAASSR